MFLIFFHFRFGEFKSECSECLRTDHCLFILVLNIKMESNCFRRDSLPWKPAEGNFPQNVGLQLKDESAVRFAVVAVAASELLLRVHSCCRFSCCCFSGCYLKFCEEHACSRSGGLESAGVFWRALKRKLACENRSVVLAAVSKSR